MLRVTLNNPVIALDRFFIIIQTMKGKTFAVPRIEIISVDLKRLLAAFYLFVIFFQVIRRKSFAVPCIGVVWIYLYGSFVKFYRFIKPVLDMNHQSFVIPYEPGISVSWLKFNFFIKAFYSIFKLLKASHGKSLPCLLYT